MIRLFDVENKKVIPTEHCYTIKYLKDIMENYPECYMQVYQFLFYMKCPGPDNPYFNMKDVDVEETIIHDLDGLKFDADNMGYGQGSAANAIICYGTAVFVATQAQ